MMKNRFVKNQLFTRIQLRLQRIMLSTRFSQKIKM